MDFDLSEEQVMLQDTLAGYLAEHCTFEKRRKGFSNSAEFTGQMWAALTTQLGIAGASFPEELGGLGGGPVENMIIMKELGKALVPEPYLSTVVIGGGLLNRSAHARAAEWIGQIIEGKMTLAFAYTEPQSRYNLAAIKTTARREANGYRLDGHKIAVAGAATASHLIVTARTAGEELERTGISAFIIPISTPGITMDHYQMVDGRCASDVHFDGVCIEADTLLGVEGQALAEVERVVDEATAAVCAEACGILSTLVDSTVEYTKQRRQFGVPLSSFQVLQHRMGDMFIEMELSVSMTYMATLKLSSDAERAKAVSAAKVQIGQACHFVGQNAVQLHGGMGMTDELAVAHYFKRATLIETTFGSTDHHLARFAKFSRPQLA